ncbi:MAG: cysteine desulfurase family protein [Eubacteriales bacterium]|nr:cysteine desulfurase family protein [Eubacteriales bacterium]
MLYLDHAATTPPDERVLNAMAKCMREHWHNPSAAYSAAGSARKVLREARGTLAGMLRASPGEIAFTSCGTESNALALQLARGRHAVVCAAEHASVLHAARAVCAEVSIVPVDAQGRVSPEDVLRAVRDNTALISVQYANNETGVIQPVREIGAIARRLRVPLHCDAVQAFGHVPIDVRAENIDLLSLSAHKFYGPRGAGALYLRQGIRPQPLLTGGGQENGLRSGTENIAAICGMAEAARLAQEDMAERAQREARLMRPFGAALRSRVPSCIELCGASPRLPGVRAYLLPGLEATQAIADMDLVGIQISGGAACAAHSADASHVYLALGLSPQQARCVVRISIGRATREEELLRAAQELARIYHRRTASR